MLSLAILVGYAWRRRASSTQERERVREQHGRLFLQLCFLVLPSVTTTIFQTFLCDDNFGKAGVRFLIADYEIKCHGPKYKFLRWYAIVCVLVYPVGINIVYGWLLSQHKAEVQRGKAKHLRFLYEAYKAQLEEDFRRQGRAYMLDRMRAARDPYEL